MSDKYPGGFVTAGAPAGFSVAFNGSSDYLTTANSLGINNFGTGDFTIECWVNFSVVGNGQFISAGSGGQANAYYWQYYSSQLQLGVQGGSSITVASWIPVANTWYHVAVTRSGTNVYQFVNGVQLGTTATSSQSFADGPTYIAYGGAGYFNGYISNARIIKGTALYTTTFTPPTQLFPITNTTLLTCQSPTFIDNSTTAATITQNGSPKVSNFTPFAGYQGFNPALGAAAGGVWTIDESAYYQQNRLWPIYDPYFNQTTLMLHGNGTNGAQNNTFLDSSVNNFTITRNGNTTQGTFTPFSQTGWSNFFNGTTDYLSNTSLTNFLFTSNLSTMFATFEAWVYPTSWNNISGYGHNPLWGNNGTYATFGFYNGALQFTRGSAQTITSTSSISLNTWSHVAVTINQSTVTFYINGVSAGTGTLTAALGTRGTDFIGHQNGTGSYFAGYISNFRISTNVAYTTNFTPSTVPLIATTGTQTLTCQDNRFVDDSANNFALTVSGTPSVQAFSPFVPAYITPTTFSNYFDGNGDYLTASGANLALGAGNFTVEGWVYLTGYNGGAAAYTGIGSYPDSTALMFYINASGGYAVNVGSSDIITTGTAPLNTWIHFAIVRSSTGSNGLTLYINGISVATATSATNFTSTNAVIGRTGVSTSSNLMLGCLSNIRVLVGTALYTAAFTPPTAPLTAVSGTQLLTCQSSTFIDNSTNNFTITANGNVQPVTSPTPFPAKVDTTTLNSAYSTSLIGGSGYFDGTGDYLNTPTANTSLQFGTGDFTVEFWAYPTNLTGSTGIGSSQIIFASAGASSFMCSIWTGNVHTVKADVADLYDFASTAVRQGNWFHVAICRASGSMKCFVNGAQAGSTTADTTDYSGTGVGAIGANYSGGYNFTGYISGLRVLKGTALYNANFAPAVVPPTPSNLTNNGTQSGTLTFVVGSDAPNTLYYVCQNHSAMAGVINIVNSGTYEKVYAVSANGSSNYVINGSSNPTLTLVRGETYTFNVNATGHPFWITKASGAYSAGNVYLGTTLLTNFTNGAIFDNTAKNVLETAGGAALSSTQAKYGTTSMYFDGVGDCLISPATPNFLFGGDFTVEAWFNRDNGADGSIFVMNTSGVSYFALNVASTGYSVYLNATGPNFSPAVTLSNNTWYHVAVVRSGSTVTLYHDGTNIGTASNSSSLGSASVVGYVGGINGGLKAYIDDLRITKGVARYTTNFTPPTSQLQDQ